PQSTCMVGVPLRGKPHAIPLPNCSSRPPGRQTRNNGSVRESRQGGPWRRAGGGGILEPAGTGRRHLRRGHPGTLEEQALLLQTGQPQTAGRIVAPTWGTLLGLVRRQPPVSWWQWLGPRVLAVHEAEDEPLLCTLRRSWGRPWQVRDADGHLVATVGR